MAAVLSSKVEMTPLASSNQRSILSTSARRSASLSMLTFSAFWTHASNVFGAIGDAYGDAHVAIMLCLHPVNFHLQTLCGSLDLRILGSCPTMRGVSSYWEYGTIVRGHFMVKPIVQMSALILVIYDLDWRREKNVARLANVLAVISHRLLLCGTAVFGDDGVYKVLLLQPAFQLAKCVQMGHNQH